MKNTLEKTISYGPISAEIIVNPISKKNRIHGHVKSIELHELFEE